MSVRWPCGFPVTALGPGPSSYRSHPALSMVFLPKEVSVFHRLLFLGAFFKCSGGGAWVGPTAAHTEPGEALLGGRVGDRVLLPDSGVTKLTQCLSGVTGVCLGLGALFPGKGANLGGA